MSRLTMRKDSLEEFKSWLSSQRIPYRESVADHQVIQVAYKLGWCPIYERANDDYSYTVDSRLGDTLNRFFGERRTSRIKPSTISRDTYSVPAKPRSKPHICLELMCNGVPVRRWVCFDKTKPYTVFGYGKTPMHAYINYFSNVRRVTAYNVMV